MDIFNSEQRPIRCINNSPNSWGGGEDPSKYLEVDQIYNIEDIEVHSWHTRVYLKEFPNMWFNSVAFEEV